MADRGVSVDTQHGIKAGLVKKQMNGNTPPALLSAQLYHRLGVVSRETQDFIKAGLMRSQLDSKVSQQTLDSIRSKLGSANHEPRPEPSSHHQPRCPSPSTPPAADQVGCLQRFFKRSGSGECTEADRTGQTAS